MSNTTTTTLENLRKEYGKLRETRENYGTANLIFDLNDEDSTYIKLCIQEQKAYKELKKAERYIFLEYFIIGEGAMWDAVHEILLEKVKAGVDVRVIYDDIGCALAIPGNFHEKLRREGIDCRIFQRFVPFLFARQNNRDHRKICVIDGVTSFTGGVNLADEYINTEKRCGYWKDTAVMVRGEASWSFAVMFLTMWD